MAIKFVDDEAKGRPGPKKRAASAPMPEPQAEAVQADVPGGMPDGQLPFAKTDPKPKGRKKPLK